VTEVTIIPVVKFRTHSTLPNRIPFTVRAIRDLRGEQTHKMRVRMPRWSVVDGLTVQLNNQMLAKKMTMEKKKKMRQLQTVKLIKF